MVSPAPVVAAAAEHVVVAPAVVVVVLVLVLALVTARGGRPGRRTMLPGNLDTQSCQVT